MKGMWDQASVLHIEAHFYFEKDGGAITSADYPDTEKDAPLHMGRGGEAEFKRICDAMRS